MLYIALLNRIKVQRNGFLNICQGFLLGISLTDAAGQGWYIDGETALITGFQHDFQSHRRDPLYSFATPANAGSGAARSALSWLPWRLLTSLSDSAPGWCNRSSSQRLTSVSGRMPRRWAWAAIWV